MRNSVRVDVALRLVYGRVVDDFRIGSGWPSIIHRIFSTVYKAYVMTELRLQQIQSAMAEAGISAWLLYNFRDSNAIASHILGLKPGTHQTRRWAVLIPAEGKPRGLVHRIEPHIAQAVPGDVTFYSSRVEFEAALRGLLEGHQRVAMEYSPNNALPVVARVDAGSVELVRGWGILVESSGELIARLESTLTSEQVQSGIRAGNACRKIMMNAFAFIRDNARSGTAITEYDVVAHILADLEAHGLETDHDPNCSVNANSANPHYQPTKDTALSIEHGSFVLIDLWGRERVDVEGGTVFGDITWTGYVGTEVPQKYEDVFQVVRAARDASWNAVQQAFARGERVSGAALDDAARHIIEEKGYGQYFIHRTGHSITSDLHGAGTNLDNFETMDDRPILPATSFSIEPGIYLPGKFGIRLELDVVITEAGEVHATSEPLQTTMLPILDDNWN